MLSIRDAVAAKDTADAQYRDAVVAAHRAGRSYASIAAEAGVSRQAVRQMVERAGGREAWLAARIAELDARYDKLVDAIAARDDPGVYAKRLVQAGRNGQAKKRARKGLGPLPTVTAEIRARAEAQLLRVLDDRVGDPTVDAVRLEIDEAWTLRKELELLQDARSGIF